MAARLRFSLSRTSMLISTARLRISSKIISMATSMQSLLLPMPPGTCMPPGVCTSEMHAVSFALLLFLPTRGWTRHSVGGSSQMQTSPQGGVPNATSKWCVRGVVAPLHEKYLGVHHGEHHRRKMVNNYLGKPCKCTIVPVASSNMTCAKPQLHPWGLSARSSQSNAKAMENVYFKVMPRRAPMGRGWAHHLSRQRFVESLLV